MQGYKEFPADVRRIFGRIMTDYSLKVVNETMSMVLMKSGKCNILISTEKEKECVLLAKKSYKARFARGELGTNPVRVDIPNPTGLRMPSGNELGANALWLPGGKTSGGVLEATVDQIQFGAYATEFILK